MSIYSDKLAHVEVVIKWRYSVAQMCTRKDMLAHTFGDKREAHLLDESVLPVTEKERRSEGKSSIGPRMKYKIWVVFEISSRS